MAALSHFAPRDDIKDKSKRNNDFSFLGKTRIEGSKSGKKARTHFYDKRKAHETA